MLEVDGEFLRNRLTQAQREALKERGEVNPDLYEAVWVGTEEHQRMVEGDQKRRREEYEAPWGTQPPW